MQLSEPAFLPAVLHSIKAIDGRALELAVDLLHCVRGSGGTVYTIGNGGSAATASHMACDLTKATGNGSRTPLRMVALSDSPALLTAWANDVSFSDVFSRQLAIMAQPDDLVLAISVSGTSPNILEGLQVARRVHARTLGLLGGDGGAAIDLVDVALHVPCEDYGMVETVHQGLVHALTAGLRARDGGVLAT
jgi:D-sedoheptulose 7-phosphate isomerase